MTVLAVSAAGRPWPLGSLRFWRAYLVTMRPYLCVVSCAAGLVGLALGRAPFGLRQLGATVALFLSYGFGQALTDVFQIDTDSRSAPYRPLCRGELGARSVLGVSLVGLGACGLAPVVVVDDQVHGAMSPASGVKLVEEIIAREQS